jgi:hypothetical protein
MAEGASATSAALGLFGNANLCVGLMGNTRWTPCSFLRVVLGLVSDCRCIHAHSGTVGGPRTSVTPLLSQQEWGQRLEGCYTGCSLNFAPRPTLQLSSRPLFESGKHSPHLHPFWDIMGMPIFDPAQGFLNKRDHLHSPSLSPVSSNTS